MTGIIVKIVAVAVAISVLIGTLINFYKPESPVFGEESERIQYKFDEGEFIMKSYDIVVSPDGDDSNDGKIDAPLKTVEAAKAKVRLLKNADCGTITVWFREGTYVISDTLEFDSDDTTNVVYRSYPDEKVVFSGAKEYSSWSETTVNGVRAFVTDAQEDDINAVYKSGERLSRSVYPKNGTFNVANVKDEDCLNPGSDYYDLNLAFYADAANVMQFKNVNDVDVRIMHYWCDELLPIANVDVSTGRIEVQKPPSMSISVGDRFFFENVFEALSEPGEWY